MGPAGSPARIGTGGAGFGKLRSSFASIGFLAPSMKLARSSQGRQAGQGKRLEVEADAAEQCSEAAHNCLLFLMCNVGLSRRQVRGKCVEYQEGFRLPNNNVVSQGGRKER